MSEKTNYGPPHLSAVVIETICEHDMEHGTKVDEETLSMIREVAEKCCLKGTGDGKKSGLRPMSEIVGAGK